MNRTPFYSAKQEIANRWTHIAGIVFFIPAGYLLLQRTQTFVQQDEIVNKHLLMVSILLTTLGYLLNYFSSVMYHSSNSINKTTWRKADHIAIFWAIAGVYFPFIAFYYELTGKGIWMFYLMTSLAIAGTLFKLFLLNTPKWVYTAVYVLMGWTVVFFGEEFFSHLPSKTIQLLILGGVFYTIGVAFYLSKKLYYSHAIWHLFVLLGGISHYFSIWFLFEGNSLLQ